MLLWPELNIGGIDNLTFRFFCFESTDFNCLFKFQICILGVLLRQVKKPLFASLTKCEKIDTYCSFIILFKSYV